MSSDVQISNMALTIIGADRIASLTDENSDEAKHVNAIFSMVRDEVLRAHTWNFAIKRVGLSQDTETPAYEHSYRYLLPTDCLRVIATESPTDHQVEGDYLVTDADYCNIKYIAQITDTSKFDSLFSSALAARLAAELAYNMAANATLAQNLILIYEDRINKARGADSQEGTPQELTTSLWEDSREIQ